MVIDKSFSATTLPDIDIPPFAPVFVIVASLDEVTSPDSEIKPFPDSSTVNKPAFILEPVCVFIPVFEVSNIVVAPLLLVFAVLFNVIPLAPTFVIVKSPSVSTLFPITIPPFAPVFVCSTVIPATLSTTSPVILIKLFPLFVIVVAFFAPTFPLIFIPPVLDDSLTIFVVPLVAELFNVPDISISPLVLFCTRTFPFEFITLELLTLILPLDVLFIVKSFVVIFFPFIFIPLAPLWVIVVFPAVNVLFKFVAPLPEFVINASPVELTVPSKFMPPLPDLFISSEPAFIFVLLPTFIPTLLVSFIVVLPPLVVFVPLANVIPC